jgi:uncharacterized protein YbaR (Trm112 family)
MARKQIAY